MKQIEVVAAIIRDEEGRLFATQRGYGEWKDWWEFPGGKMEAVGLKNLPNFMDYSLTPAIREGFVCMKYPANPHHPRQRYLLTVKGLMLLDGNNS